jgi:hypothetical protein
MVGIGGKPYVTANSDADEDQDTVLFRPSVHTFGKFWSKKLQKKSDNSKEKHFG